MFHSCNFYVNEAIKTTFGSQSRPQTSRSQSILQTFGIKTHVTKPQKYDNEKHT